jgi:enoyl-CoA hydratase/carnithine racemase
VTGGTEGSEFTLVRYDVTDHIATITLDDPEHLNNITHGPDGMQGQLVRALRMADDDPDVRCVVVTGAGRAFCSGGNMGSTNVPRETAAEWHTFLESHVRFYEEVRNRRKPSIGAINGMCYGAGFIMASHLDLLVASDAARFGLIEARFGAGGVDVFPYLVGAQWAKFLVLSGEIISARKAKEIGLILETVEHDRLLDRVYDLARRIAAMPAEAVAMNRRVVDDAMLMMGWRENREHALALNAINISNMRNVTTLDGRKLMEILENEGFPAFREARDAPFDTPWLED